MCPAVDSKDFVTTTETAELLSVTIMTIHSIPHALYSQFQPKTPRASNDVVGLPFVPLFQKTSLNNSLLPN